MPSVASRARGGRVTGPVGRAPSLDGKNPPAENRVQRRSRSSGRQKTKLENGRLSAPFCLGSHRRRLGGDSSRRRRNYTRRWKRRGHDRRRRRQRRRSHGPGRPCLLRFHGGQLIRQRKRRGRCKVLWRMLQIMTGWQGHPPDPRLASGQSPKRQGKTGQPYTVPALRAHHPPSFPREFPAAKGQ
jgi:hypothetical protein